MFSDEENCFLEKEYHNARQHFIYTSDGSQCAAFLIEYHVVAGFPGEIDLFITQAVLQYVFVF